MNKARFARWLEDSWYREMYIAPWFTPLSMLYVDIVRLRRWLYRIGLLKTSQFPVPVIVVGNLTVGGTGKTPLVIWLVEQLKQKGYKPGIVSRGYAGKTAGSPQSVNAESNVAQVGDEAILLARRCACPVVVDPDRPAAVRHLLSQHACDVIISDDGLQHYALARNIEIVVVDGQRRFGNGYCLPTGPLREPLERLRQVDFVVVNGGSDIIEGEITMQCQGDQLVNLLNGNRKGLRHFADQPCRAIAGIGNPKRFFSQLANAGVTCETLAFPDHHTFSAEDLQFSDHKPLLMTEKDAVKCAAFAQAHHWYLPIDAELPDTFGTSLLTLLKEKTHG
jgi:tetraacyldisaccharide 4'-kinase